MKAQLLAISRKHKQKEIFRKQNPVIKFSWILLSNEVLSLSPALLFFVVKKGDD